MRDIRIVFIASLLLVGLFAGGHLTANAESVEEAYDRTFAAYNRTLNLLEECDEAFANFQQFFKEQRPPDGAPKEEWDKWGKAYRVWVDLYLRCISNLKKEADDLKKKLDDLQRQLDGLAGTEPREPPRKGVKEKAQNLVNKGKKDHEGWTIGVRYKIRQVNGWSQEASEKVRDHGSGQVKIEPRFEFKF